MKTSRTVMLKAYIGEFLFYSYFYMKKGGGELKLKGKAVTLNPQWFAVIFFIFIGGLYIYSKTKNKIFYCVFIYV